LDWKIFYGNKAKLIMMTFAYRSTSNLVYDPQSTPSSVPEVHFLYSYVAGPQGLHKYRLNAFHQQCLGTPSVMCSKYQALMTGYLRFSNLWRVGGSMTSPAREWSLWPRLSCILTSSLIGPACHSFDHRIRNELQTGPHPHIETLSKGT